MHRVAWKPGAYWGPAEAQTRVGGGHGTVREGGSALQGLLLGSSHPPACLTWDQGVKMEGTAELLTWELSPPHTHTNLQGRSWRS